jgi:hypothetical protein
MAYFQSQSYFTTGSRQAPSDARPVILFSKLNTCSCSPYVTSPLMRGRVCRLQLLLVFVSAVILRSESSGTHDHILLSQIRDSSSLEGQLTIGILLPRTGRSSYTPQVLGSLFVASYDSQGCSGGMLIRVTLVQV